MTTRLLKTAATLIGVSALLHFAVVWLSDFSAGSQHLLIFGAIYIFVAALVWINSRWVVWLAFFLTLFDGIAAMAAYLNPEVIPQQFALGIWVINWLAALCLFISLWRDKSFRPHATTAKLKETSTSERKAPEL